MDRDELLQEFAALARDDNWLWVRIEQEVQTIKRDAHRANMVRFLKDSFLLAYGMGLSHPMIRVIEQQRRYKIRVNRKGTLCFESGLVIPGTSDPEGNEEYIACIWQGRFFPAKDRKLLPEEEAFFDSLASDPCGYLAKRSKDMDRCCYCWSPLEDARSKQAGYGPTCAKRWALPWGKSYDEKVPTFAEAWAKAGAEGKPSVQFICDAIRKTPHEPMLWFVLGDALEDAGITGIKPRMPKEAFILPQ